MSPKEANRPVVLTHLMVHLRSNTQSYVVNTTGNHMNDQRFTDSSLTPNTVCDSTRHTLQLSSLTSSPLIVNEHVGRSLVRIT